MPDQDNPFSTRPQLTGLEARRALQHLAQHRLMVSITGSANRREQVSSVAGGGASAWNAVVLDHPAGAPLRKPAFAEGEALELLWNESGIRYGASARVLRVRRSDPPAYEVEILPELRRLERRRAQRVPLESDDGVRAELLLTGRAEPVTAMLKDLSIDGCRLALTAAEAREAGLEAGAQVELALALPGGSTQRGRLLLLRVEQADERICEFGASWVAPAGEFTDRIARFVAIKQHAMLHRRAQR